MSLATVRVIVFWLFLGAIVGEIIHFLWWNAMYLLLRKKYDPLLFREPYFTPGELVVYSAWPLSLGRATSYIKMIAGWRRFNRFRNLDIPIVESAFVRFLCHAWINALWIIVTTLLVCTLYGGIDMLFFSESLLSSNSPTYKS